MRKMKSRILAAILAAGMIFTAQGMTALAGTIGVGAAKTGQSTGGPGETVKDVENATADNENAGSGEQEKVSGGASAPCCHSTGSAWSWQPMDLLPAPTDHGHLNEILPEAGVIFSPEEPFP